MNYYDEIKRELINNELTKKIKDYGKNKSDLNTYYNVGKILNKADKRYGKGVIKDYSKRLSLDLNARYEASSLNKMKKFYLLIEKMATVSPKLSYSHYVELLPYEDIDKVKYYIKMVENQNLSVRELRYKIKSKVRTIVMENVIAVLILLTIAAGRNNTIMMFFVYGNDRIKFTFST